MPDGKEPVAVNQARADEGPSLHNAYGDRRCLELLASLGLAN